MAGGAVRTLRLWGGTDIGVCSAVAQLRASAAGGARGRVTPRVEAFRVRRAALEVGLKNSLHRELSAQASSPSWWRHLQFTGGDDDLIDKALDEIEKRKQNIWTPGHVVAELRFAFWVGLLANRNHARFWEAGLVNAFPHYPTTRRRDYLHESFERLRLLRNRAAHHEPIHARDLMIDHELMCELAGYIDPDLQMWIKTHTRLPTVVAGRNLTLTAARITRF